MTQNAPNRPLPTWPQFDAEQIEAVCEVLRSGQVNSWTGRVTEHFEAEYAASLGRKHAIAVSNGSVALEIALRALGVGPGDEVVVTPRSFVASASCVVNVGARPIFADVDRNSGNLTAETIGAVLSERTRAIVLVHLAGWPCEMHAISALAQQRGLAVVEDCAQAHGAGYHGRPIGAFGHVAAFSFCQDKIITTGGEGGLLVTDDTALWRRMWSLKEHGKSYAACFETRWPAGFRWLHEGSGTNARMTEMQAAIGRVALRRLPDWLARRREIASRLGDAWRACPLIRDPQIEADVQHAFYRRYCYLEPAALRAGWTRQRIVETLTGLGVPCFTGSCSEIYLEQAFQEQRPVARLPVAQELGETALAFLVHPTLEDADVEWMCTRIQQVLNEARA